jgi:hypothetical protein
VGSSLPTSGQILELPSLQGQAAKKPRLLRLGHYQVVG